MSQIHSVVGSCRAAIIIPMLIFRNFNFTRIICQITQAILDKGKDQPKVYIARSNSEVTNK